MSVRILNGDCREVLKTLPDESVHCCVTSPPYWGLRDYGHAGQLGLEDSPEEYVERMVSVFQDVRRVLRGDGTLWLNLGDSYNAYNGNAGPSSGFSAGSAADTQRPKLESGHGLRTKGLKPKDLVGIPWRVAFALQADGWYLRQDIIWAKPNHMPESVTDRCTKAHEYIFMLSKSARYYYDQEAIKVPAIYGDDDRKGRATEDHKSMPTAERNGIRPDKQRGHGRRHAGFNDRWDAMEKAEQCSGMVNKRSVWTVATQPFKEAHFATFPPALIEPCILAGCPAACCSVCGAPRVTLYSRGVEAKEVEPRDPRMPGEGYERTRKVGGQYQKWLNENPKLATGVNATCDCDAPDKPGAVLDPFFGAGTTGLVADRHGRDCIGIELNPEYAEMARKRITNDSPLFAEVA